MATLLWMGKTAVHFLIKTPLLMQSSVSMANSHISKSHTVESLLILFG